VNDDGVYGEGLRPLARALGSLGEVTVVVPDPASGSIRLLNGDDAMPRALKTWFDSDGTLHKDLPEEAIEALRQLDASEAPD